MYAGSRTGDSWPYSTPATATFQCPMPDGPRGGGYVTVSRTMRATHGVRLRFYDGPEDDRDPSIVQLKNGRMICNFFSLRQVPERGLGVWTITSDDLGKTWSASRQIYGLSYYCETPPSGVVHRPAHPGPLIRRTADTLAMYLTAPSALALTAEKPGARRSIRNGGHRLKAETRCDRID